MNRYIGKNLQSEAKILALNGKESDEEIHETFEEDGIRIPKPYSMLAGFRSFAPVQTDSQAEQESILMRFRRDEPEWVTLRVVLSICRIADGTTIDSIPLHPVLYGMHGTAETISDVLHRFPLQNVKPMETLFAKNLF